MDCLILARNRFLTMKIAPLFLVLALMLSSCQNDAGSKIDTSSESETKTQEIDNSNVSKDAQDLKPQNNTQNNSDPKNQETNVSDKGEMQKPETLYASADIDNFGFANNPFDSEDIRADLFKTAFIKLDTGVYPSPINGQSNDTLLYFYYDDQSEISLLIRPNETKIVFAALVSNILPLKDNIAIGMNKVSFWSSFPNMANIHKDFNILRIVNEDKLIWVGLQFQDDVLKILEYNGSNR